MRGNAPFPPSEEAERAAEQPGQRAQARLAQSEAARLATLEASVAPALRVHAPWAVEAASSVGGVRPSHLAPSGGDGVAQNNPVPTLNKSLNFGPFGAIFFNASKLHC